MNRIFFIILFCFATAAVAQDDVRHFHQVIKTSKDAEKKADALLDLSNYYYKNVLHQDYPFALDSAAFYIKKAEQFCLKSNNQQGLGRAYDIHASIINIDYREQDHEKRYQKALKYIDKAIAIFTKLNDLPRLGEVYYSLYKIGENIKPYEETIATAEKAKALVSKGEDEFLLGCIAEDMAFYYGHTGNLNKALAMANEAIGIYKKTDPESLHGVYSFIGALYNEKGDYELALPYCLKGIENVEKYKKEDFRVVDTYNYAGVTYRGLKKYDEAFKYFKKAVSVAEKLENEAALAFYEANAAEAALLSGNKAEAAKYLFSIERKIYLIKDPMYVNALVVLTNSYIKLNDSQKADKFAKVILENYTSYDNTPDQVWARTTFSGVLMKYFFYKKDFNNARKYTLIYKKEVEATHSKPKIMHAYNTLFKIDSAQGNYLSAIRYNQLEAKYKDSIYNETKNRQLTELEVQYETSRKEKDNLLLKKQTELQKSQIAKSNLMRNISTAGAILLVVIMLLLYRRYRITQKLRKTITGKNQALEEILNAKENLIKEKEWLLKEIHHRIKNNLQIVMSLLGTQTHFLNDRAAREAIKNSQHRIHSMSLIHKKLYQSENIATVNIEIYFKELIEYYKVAFDTKERIRFNVQIAPVELDSNQAVPLGLIFNEAVNNALKHAFPDNQNGAITITLEVAGEVITLKIKDNGTGMQEKPAGYDSLGLNLIKGFSRELNADLQFSNDNGVEISVIFNIEHLR